MAQSVRALQKWLRVWALDWFAYKRLTASVYSLLELANPGSQQVPRCQSIRMQKIKDIVNPPSSISPFFPFLLLSFFLPTLKHVTKYFQHTLRKNNIACNYSSDLKNVNIFPPDLIFQRTKALQMLPKPTLCSSPIQFPSLLLSTEITTV